jgi:hypothetical protein
MPSRSTTPISDAVELSIEDIMLDTWLEDSGDYLRLDAPERPPRAPVDAWRRTPPDHDSA